MRAPVSPSWKNEALILLLILAAGFAFRTVFSTAVMPPPLKMQGETTQAYRYARMISLGQEIPSLDTLVMRPAGMTTGENSIMQEYLAGGLHRVTGGDFDAFIIFFSRFFPLLAMPVIFFWMKRLGFSHVHSLTGALIYAVFLPALLRSRGESLYRETVALPLLLAALALTDAAADRTQKTLNCSIPAAAALFAALAGWKVTGFISFFLFVHLAFSRPGLRTVLPLAAAQLAASLLLSHMRHDGALYSPATIMAIGAVAASITGSLKISFAGLAAAVMVPLFLSSPATGHVTSLIAAKIRFLNTHPTDPLQLSPEARLFWVSGYTSPSPGQFLLLFLPAIPAVIAGWRGFRRIAGNSLMFWFFPMSLAGYLFFDRLHVLLAAAAIPPVVAAAIRWKPLLPALALIFGVQSMAAPGLAGLISSTGMETGGTPSLLGDRELDGLLEWAVGKQGTVLSYWHISGLLSAYSETPVVTHTFFENADNRQTIRRFAEMMFASEEQMISFMQEKGAEYLVYQADFIFDRTPQGLLYLAGLTGVPDGSLAVRLHYYPGSLTHLVPVWQGPSIRVYGFSQPEYDLEPHALWQRDYAPFISNAETALAVIADPVAAGLRFGETGMLTGDALRVSAGLLLLSKRPDIVPAEAAVELLQQLVMAHLSRGYSLEKLEGDFVEYLRAWGPDPMIRLDLVRLLRAGGMDDRASFHMMLIESMGAVQR